jgi:hypothetical protein
MSECGIPCYKDKYFCPFFESCKKGEECDRALTPDVAEDEEAYILGISAYPNKPECFEDK